MSYVVSFGPCKKGYDGTFGSTKWENSGAGWTFHTLPETSCCGFVLCEGNTTQFFKDEMVLAFIKLAFISGFAFYGHKNDFYSGQSLQSVCNNINEKVDCFKLHWDEPEPGFQVFVVEILDAKKFDAWRNK